jgi:recombinational DNA repair protein RecR
MRADKNKEREYNTQWVRANRYLKRALGLCWNCKNMAAKGHTRCQSCLDKRRTR